MSSQTFANRLVNFCQIDKILPNLVTLIGRLFGTSTDHCLSWSTLVKEAGEKMYLKVGSKVNCIQCVKKIVPSKPIHLVHSKSCIFLIKELYLASVQYVFLIR